MVAQSTAATGQNVVLWAGDEVAFRVPLFDEAGAKVLLAGVPSAFWYLEQSGAVILEKGAGTGVSIETDADQSVVVVQMARADTEDRPGIFDHRIRILDGDGRLLTVTEGRIQIKASPGRPA